MTKEAHDTDESSLPDTGDTPMRKWDDDALLGERDTEAVEAKDIDQFLEMARKLGFAESDLEAIHKVYKGEFSK